MKLRLVVFGHSISSSWGNRHATLWRGLCKSLNALGHSVVFYERDRPFYASKRDLPSPPPCELVLYRDVGALRAHAERELRAADCAIVTSRCPDAVAATEMVTASNIRLRVFYDLDAPVTIARLEAGEAVEYVGPRAYRDFDLVLSLTGGSAIDELTRLVGARRVCPLFASADPDVYFPAHVTRWSCDFSYLGTYAEDRKKAVDELFFEVARSAPHLHFSLAGAHYPSSLEMPLNVAHVPHVAPSDLSAFYGSSGFTLNVARGAKARIGYGPSAKLFEAAAAGTPVVTDAWVGLEHFFEPGREIVLATSTDDVLRALAMPSSERTRIAAAARRRVLAHHTSTTRARELVRLLTDGVLRARAEEERAAQSAGATDKAL